MISNVFPLSTEKARFLPFGDHTGAKIESGSIGRNSGSPLPRLSHKLPEPKRKSILSSAIVCPSGESRRNRVLNGYTLWRSGKRFPRASYHINCDFRDCPPPNTRIPLSETDTGARLVDSSVSRKS